jgi:hypothetical protein
MVGRKQASADAQGKYLADVALAANFDDLLAAARTAEHEFRRAQATVQPVDVRYRLAKKLDTALTDAMRSAFAAVRAEIGPLGYDDRIVKRNDFGGARAQHRGGAPAHAERDAPADRNSAAARRRGTQPGPRGFTRITLS